MKELLKLSSILALICCAAALALGSVHELTREPIARQQRLKIQRAVAAVLPGVKTGSGTEGSAVRLCEDENPASCREVFLLSKGADIRGIALEAEETGYSGPITAMVGIMPDGAVSGVRVISHSETPGLGARITQEQFLAQFAASGADAGNLELKKNGGTIDQVTGATISSEALLRAVREQIRFFNANRERIFSAHAGAQKP